MEKIEITLSAETVQFIRSEIALGHFKSDSEMIQAALQSWQPETLPDWLPSQSLMREMIAQASCDPSECFTEEEMDTYFEQKFAEADAKYPQNG